MEDLFDYLINGRPEEMPQEVWVVLNLPFEMMGVDQYNEFKAIKKKYPQYFPWEARYDEIPKEVHEAYQKETKPYLFIPFKEIDETDFEGKGLLQSIKESGENVSYSPTTFTIEDFDRAVRISHEETARRVKQYKKDKAIWDKHYAKYELRYIG